MLEGLSVLMDSGVGISLQMGLQDFGAADVP